MRRRAKKAAREPPEQTEWVGLVRLDAIPAFAAWLSAPRQWWELDEPAEGELLRAHKHGRCIVVAWDERRGATICPRAVMVLWYAFVFDTSNNNNF